MQGFIATYVHLLEDRLLEALDCIRILFSWELPIVYVVCHMYARCKKRKGKDGYVEIIFIESTVSHHFLTVGRSHYSIHMHTGVCWWFSQPLVIRRAKLEKSYLWKLFIYFSLFIYLFLNEIFHSTPSLQDQCSGSNDKIAKSPTESLT